MPYYVINDLPVFISDSKEKILLEQALGDQSLKFHVKSFVGSSEEVEKRERAIIKFLQDRFNEDNGKFHTDWVEFDLEGESASKNITDLLYDFCQYSDFGEMSEVRDHGKKIEQERIKDIYYYPLGRVFLVDFGRKRNFIKRLFGGAGVKSVRLEIDVESVYRLKGMLTDFEVHSEDFQLVCSKKISLIPKSLAFSQQQK